MDPIVARAMTRSRGKRGNEGMIFINTLYCNALLDTAQVLEFVRFVFLESTLLRVILPVPE